MAVGEVMAIGKTFEEAIQKAARMVSAYLYVHVHVCILTWSCRSCE
jgi:carbamoylphosphate synthase large subunit